MQELFKGGDIEDLVRGRLGCVDDVLYYFVKYAHTTWSAKRRGFFFLVALLLLLAFCLCLLGVGGGGGKVGDFGTLQLQNQAPPLGRNYSKGQELM